MGRSHGEPLNIPNWHMIFGYLIFRHPFHIFISLKRLPCPDTKGCFNVTIKSLLFQFTPAQHPKPAQGLSPAQCHTQKKQPSLTSPTPKNPDVRRKNVHIRNFASNDDTPKRTNLLPPEVVVRAHQQRWTLFLDQLVDARLAPGTLLGASS